MRLATPKLGYERLIRTNSNVFTPPLKFITVAASTSSPKTVSKLRLSQFHILQIKIVVVEKVVEIDVLARGRMLKDGRGNAIMATGVGE